MNGKLDEMFGSGTAAVISPVGLLEWHGKKLVINNGEVGKFAHMLYDGITGIQFGKTEDPFGWRHVIER